MMNQSMFSYNSTLFDVFKKRLIGPFQNVFLTGTGLFSIHWLESRAYLHAEIKRHITAPIPYHLSQ